MQNPSQPHWQQQPSNPHKKTYKFPQWNDPPRPLPDPTKGKLPSTLLSQVVERFRKAEDLCLQAAHLLVQAKEEVARGEQLEQRAYRWQQDLAQGRFRAQEAVWVAAEEHRGEERWALARQAVAQAEAQQVEAACRQAAEVHRARVIQEAAVVAAVEAAAIHWAEARHLQEGRRVRFQV